MKLLLIAPGAKPVSSHTGGSVEIAVYQIAKRLSSNHRVTVLSRTSKLLPAVSRSGNLTIKRIPAGKRYLSNILRHARKEPYDCIQVDNRPYYIPYLRKSLPHSTLILNLHSLTFFNRLSEMEKNTVLESADAIVCNSQFITNHYKELYPQYDFKFHTIYLGVDLKRFRPPKEEKKQKIRSKYKVKQTYNVLYVGRVIPKKGVHTLVQAAGILKKMYDNTRLIVVGDCNKTYRAQLEELAQEKKVSLSMIGSMPPSRIHLAYWLGDCFVCPTQFKEAFGLVNVEAMASGLPVIASNTGGIPEIIHNGNGILVDQIESPYPFAYAIEQVLASTSFTDEMTERAKLSVRLAFSWENTVNQFQQLYRFVKGNNTLW